jgi:integrase
LREKACCQSQNRCSTAELNWQTNRPYFGQLKTGGKPIRHPPGSNSADEGLAKLFRFPLLSDVRINEAWFITLVDVDFQRQMLRARITKNGKTRWIPFTPACAISWTNSEPPVPMNRPMLALWVFECQKSIDRAATLTGVKRITHHDLRHLFATRCIENGVDIPTVSRWLGHQDGGALCMKTYGHLRDEHSHTQARKVTF